MIIIRGDVVMFKPKKGKIRKGLVTGTNPAGKVAVKLEGDPFSVWVSKSQLSACNVSEDAVRSTPTRKVPKENTTMTTKTDNKPSAKELRQKAKSKGVKGWEKMGYDELAKAVAAKSKPQSEDAPKATKTKTKEGGGKKSKKGPKSSPKKTKPEAKAEAPEVKSSKKSKGKTAKATKAAKTDEVKGVRKNHDAITTGKVTPPADGANPFRKGSNAAIAGALLLKGGKRRTLAEKLSTKINLHPYQKESDAVDLLDYDKRLLLTAQVMRDKHGFSLHRTGRGMEGTIRVFVPGGEGDPATKASKKGSKKKG